MKNLQSTYTTAQLGKKVENLSYEDLKRASQKIVVGSSGTGKTKGWFERFMNRMGWYRKSEWYILRESQFTRWPFLDKRPELMKDDG